MKWLKKIRATYSLPGFLQHKFVPSLSGLAGFTYPQDPGVYLRPVLELLLVFAAAEKIHMSLVIGLEL
jgi:hypothetical protein